jgi:hypothetical protein
MKLYELTAELEQARTELEAWAEEHEGDISECPALLSLELAESDIEDKALNIACLVKDWSAQADAISVEKKRLEQREKVLKNRSDYLKRYLSKNIPEGKKFENARAVISWRKSNALLVDIPPEELPEQYQKVKTEADKTGIKAAIKSGEEIQGCTLETRHNIQIK